MKVLILGGTRFLGRHVVVAAGARGHEVTLFNRGNYSSEDLGASEIIQGDRHTELHKLRGRHWDTVVDTSGHLPRAVTAAAQVLSGAVDRYVFISTQNAYKDVSVPGIEETYPRATLTDEQLHRAYAIDTSGQPSYGELYGGLKSLCEQAAEEVMPNRVLIIRPGLIVGPYDYTDRFTYWPVRVAAGGEVLAPGPADRFIQFIDVRDLAEWIVTMIERKATGVYNAHGLPGRLTMQCFLDECKSAAGSDAQFTWVSEDFLLQEKVAAWSELPLWLPQEAAPHLKGFMFISPAKAVAAGLNFRPLNETIRDTLSWFQSTRSNDELKAGLDRDKERPLLYKWHDSRGHS
jgi:2'-hydroxyisoflavone reductase